MDEKENTGTESSAVTAIKVKVVIDTNKKELDQQFNSVKEHYKEKPVKIAFGVNQNDTIRNINDALDKVVKSGKLKTPKVTLDVKIDQSKVTAQLKKAMQSAEPYLRKSRQLRLIPESLVLQKYKTLQKVIFLAFLALQIVKQS